jgi:S1-C subfamily serine protease
MRSPVSLFLQTFVLVLIGFAGGAWWTHRSRSEPPEPAMPPAVAQPAVAVPAELAGEEARRVRVFETASRSVVYITSTALQQVGFFSRRTTEVPVGTGSGFLWDRRGHVVTNFHVIQNADSARVTLADRSSWPARLVGVAPEKDLAVLRIEAPAEVLEPLPLGTSETLRVGQDVLAIGNPFGLDQTLTTGVVSALGREIESLARVPIRDVVQTDAAINPGNSGGPLLDSSGRLVGVNTMIYSPSGTSAGIGFAIPVDTVAWVVPELVTHGRVKRPTLGVELAPPQIAARLGLRGGLILDVLPGSGAEQSGLRPTRRDRSGGLVLGDIILAVEDIAVTGGADLMLALERREAGQTVRVRVLREGREVEVPVQLSAPR